ncbi:MAG: phosphopantetheine-binding protein [Bacteroidota bacterium]
MIPKSLLDILQVVCEDKPQVPAWQSVGRHTHLRNDLQLDSLELAELSIRIEDAYGTDLFSESRIECVGDILERITP